MRKKDSEDLVRVGPGTAMGGLMREYWLPAAMSSELERDGAPQRLLLLGEKLIAFRDSSGRVGVMDHRCPHRCASLFLGRNEANGIRCVYHGWKYDTEGNCVDTPNLAGNPDFKNRIKAKAYKSVERNGLLWVYMGTRKKAPPLPEIEATLLPESDVQISFVQRECNWLQALEGDIDTSHFGFLHAGGGDPEDGPEGSLFRATGTNRGPHYHGADHKCGTVQAAYREAAPGKTYWRFANFMLPVWTPTPPGQVTDHLQHPPRIPRADTHPSFATQSRLRHPPPAGPDKPG